MNDIDSKYRRNAPGENMENHTIESDPCFYTDARKAAWLEHQRSVEVLRRKFAEEHWVDGDKNHMTPDAWMKEANAVKRSVYTGD